MSTEYVVCSMYCVSTTWLSARVYLSYIRTRVESRESIVKSQESTMK